jgi:serine/threonine protein phosphatase 1
LNILLSRFLRRNRPPAEQRDVSPRIPDNVRVYAIGDIHGRLDLLDALLGRIDADDASRPPSEVQLILLGDLIDRGPDSAGVVQRLLQLVQHGNVRTLMGNHEEIWLRYLDGETTLLPSFAKMGGRETILSYGIAREEFDTLPADLLLARIRDKVPADHIAAMRRFEDTIIIGDYAFVHAGIRPGIEVAQQKPEDLRWIREPFLSDKTPHGPVIVHGHSVSPQVDEQSNRIGIDTGAFVSGRLTAIGLEGAERWFLSADGEKGSARYASRRTLGLVTAQEPE